MLKIEVCAANLQSALAAQNGGAHRIELCGALDQGGVTPSAGLIRAAVKALSIPVCVLIRPREGNFVYSPSEVALMADDVRFCRDYGAAGVVIGALTDTFQLDIDALEQLIAAAGTMEVVNHRAFDFVQDTQVALTELIQLGFKRILTSGQKASAWEGRHNLAAIVQQANNQLTIMPGSGIKSLEDMIQLKAATGATEFHFSAKKWVTQPASDIAGLPAGYFVSDEEIIKTVSAGL